VDDIGVVAEAWTLQFLPHSSIFYVAPQTVFLSAFFSKLNRNAKCVNKQCYKCTLQKPRLDGK